MTEKQNEGMSLEDAVNAALMKMPEDFEIKQFLMENKAEVTKMCITEYDEAETMNSFKQEGIEEGRAEGKAEGRLDMLVNLVRKGLLSEDNAAAEAKMTVDEFRKKIEQQPAS